MKKILLTVAIILGIKISCAQELNFRFGAKGGLNIARIINSKKIPGVRKISRFASHIGLFAEAKIRKDMTISPEVFYSKQGNNTIADNTNIVTSTQYEYINIPVMLKYYVLHYVSIDLGPQVGFLLNAQKKIDQEKVTDTQMEKNTETMDYGIVAGTSMLIKERMSIGIRYYRGVADLNNSDAIKDTSVNSVIQMSLGYYF